MDKKRPVNRLVTIEIPDDLPYVDAEGTRLCNAARASQIWRLARFQAAELKSETIKKIKEHIKAAFCGLPPGSVVLIIHMGHAKNSREETGWTCLCAPTETLQLEPMCYETLVDLQEAGRCGTHINLCFIPISCRSVIDTERWERQGSVLAKFEQGGNTVCQFSVCEKGHRSRDGVLFGNSLARHMSGWQTLTEMLAAVGDEVRTLSLGFFNPRIELRPNEIVRLNHASPPQPVMPPFHAWLCLELKDPSASVLLRWHLNQLVEEEMDNLRNVHQRFEELDAIMEPDARCGRFWHKNLYVVLEVFQEDSLQDACRALRQARSRALEAQALEAETEVEEETEDWQKVDITDLDCFYQKLRITVTQGTIPLDHLVQMVHEFGEVLSRDLKDASRQQRSQQNTDFYDLCREMGWEIDAYIPSWERGHRSDIEPFEQRATVSETQPDGIIALTTMHGCRNMSRLPCGSTSCAYKMVIGWRALAFDIIRHIGAFFFGLILDDPDKAPSVRSAASKVEAN